MYKIVAMEYNFCKKCGKCCSEIKIDTNSKIMYRNGIEQVDEAFLSMLEPIKTDADITYFRCKLLKNNLCTNKEKPDICENYPSFALAFLPDDCGYEGVIFQKQEALKQKIRKLKEEIVHYNALIQTTTNKSEKQQYAKIINSHTKFIQRYKEYGSDDW